ncbi:low-specificity L-threonine aldolase [Tumebacillus flagellatus]|uniref:Threonine aldolase n=1 Tax=Tumebacillus flagellatus TaxID=1157490 RepID=A0A074LSU0_9BACL|nr:low-specificity L-threonine aldolase [Tumebacillus flagellatus]KEO85216.1 threonine aldolase [Tumebacillus flagellatus]
MIDLRSDTVTKPSEEMRKAMYNAEVGDDVYGEDPTVQKLEDTAARMLGKEAGLFVTSGTMGNQIAVLTQARSGEEIILEETSHIFLYEGATASAFGGVQTRTIKGVRGAMNPEDVRGAIRPSDIHQPVTTLICLENTHNKAGGAVVPTENMRAIHEIARENNIRVHLDGARLFNAVVASGQKPSDFAQYVDTVQFCFSKGLGAPVGSMLVGDRATIEQARVWRKRFGGGLRQVGVLAAPALLALTQNVERLAEDHANAKFLAEGLAQIPGLAIDPATVDTNIVIVNIAGLGVSETVLIDELKKSGILCGGFGPQLVRFVTHLNISKADIVSALETIQRVVRGLA